MAQLHSPAEWLGAAHLLGLKPPAHPVAFLDLVGRGLPVSSLERVVGSVAPTDTSLKYRIVPKPSFARRKAISLHNDRSALSAHVMFRRRAICEACVGGRRNVVRLAEILGETF